MDYSNADFGVKVPFYAVAVIAAVNLVIAWIYLPETRAIDENAPAQSELWRSLVPTPIRVITSIRDRRIATSHSQGSALRESGESAGEDLAGRDSDVLSGSEGRCAERLGQDRWPR